MNVLNQRRRPGRRRFAGVIAVLSVVTMGLSACGSNGNADDQAADAPDLGAVPSVEELRGSLDGFFTSTDTALPTESPAPATGKTVWVMSCSAAAEGCAVVADEAMKAGELMGWDMKLVDGKLDPNTEAGIVRQAIAAKVDGMITIAVDCPSISGALQSAKDAGIVTMSVKGFDCDNSYTGNESLYSGQLKYGEGIDYQELLTNDYSKSIAAYVTEKTDAQAEVIAFRQTDGLAPRAISDGFAHWMEACESCTLHEIEFSAKDFISGSAMQQKASAALSRYPNANVVMAPYDATILLGIGAAVTQARAAGRELILTGGEGLASNIELIEDGTQQFAGGLPIEWEGWGAVDELNRLFAGEPLVGEGIGIRAIDEDHPADCRPFIAGECVDLEGAYSALWGLS